MIRIMQIKLYEKNSLLNFLNLKINNQRKICVLGDMLELGKKKNSSIKKSH